MYFALIEAMLKKEVLMNQNHLAELESQQVEYTRRECLSKNFKRKECKAIPLCNLGVATNEKSDYEKALNFQMIIKGETDE